MQINSRIKVFLSHSTKLVFLAAVVSGLIVAGSICSGAAPTRDGAEPIWPTKEWQMCTPEEQGTDSKELAKLVDWGTTHSFDSLLVARHGKIVAEAYYAPYAAGIPHAIYSCTKVVISTLMAIASKEGLLDSPSHLVLDFSAVTALQTSTIKRKRSRSRPCWTALR